MSDQQAKGRSRRRSLDGLTHMHPEIDVGAGIARAAAHNEGVPLESSGAAGVETVKQQVCSLT